MNTTLTQILLGKAPMEIPTIYPQYNRVLAINEPSYDCKPVKYTYTPTNMTLRAQKLYSQHRLFAGLKLFANIFAGTNYKIHREPNCSYVQTREDTGEVRVVRSLRQPQDT